MSGWDGSPLVEASQVNERFFELFAIQHSKHTRMKIILAWLELCCGRWHGAGIKTDYSGKSLSITTTKACVLMTRLMMLIVQRLRLRNVKHNLKVMWWKQFHGAPKAPKLPHRFSIDFTALSLIFLSTLSYKSKTTHLIWSPIAQ